MIFQRIATKKTFLWDHVIYNRRQGTRPSDVVYFHGWCVKLNDLTWRKKRPSATSMRWLSVIIQSLRLGDVRIQGAAHALGMLTANCCLSILVRTIKKGVGPTRTFPPRRFTRPPQQQCLRHVPFLVESNSSPLCLYLFTWFAETIISALQIQGLAVFKRRPSRTLMACEEFFQMLVETLCCYDLLPFPDDSVPASYLVKFMIPSAP